MEKLGSGRLMTESIHYKTKLQSGNQTPHFLIPRAVSLQLVVRAWQLHGVGPCVCAGTRVCENMQIEK